MTEDIKTHTWIKSFSKQMLSELFVMVNMQKEQKDPAVLRKLLNNFLSSFVGSMAITALSRTPAKTDSVNSKEELMKFTQANLLSVKQDIAEAVSLGFEAALYNYSGKEIEYYCTIKPVSQPVSKKVH
jgi:hypothetical protein